MPRFMLPRDMLCLKSSSKAAPFHPSPLLKRSLMYLERLKAGCLQLLVSHDTPYRLYLHRLKEAISLRIHLPFKTKI